MVDQRSPRVVVITGGSRGIGRAVAVRFAVETPRLFLIHYDPDEVASQETLRILDQKGVEAQSRKLDVSSRQAVDECFANILEKHGRIERGGLGCGHQG
jgi:NAD(P)-dependent dehydrogenase (short-subunit alcohol dehydrogenase family)